MGKQTLEGVGGGAIVNAEVSPAVGESRAASTVEVELLGVERSSAVIVADDVELLSPSPCAATVNYSSWVISFVHLCVV